jgi:acetylglutamate kinase
MAPKVRSLVDAVRAGVTRAHVIDGFEPHTLLLEVFTRRGRGTMIVERGGAEEEDA